MRKPSIINTIVAASLGLGSVLSAQTDIYSDPLGFNSVVCLANSDTIVGVPLRPNGSQQGSLGSDPVNNGNDTATLTLAGSPGFMVDEFATTPHYVKFTSGNLDGHFYPIDSNGEDTLTIDLNQAVITGASGATTDDGVLIAKFWTLETLFPAADATNDPTTTPHAIVASASTHPLHRRTTILLPNLDQGGINIPPARSFFIDDSTDQWVENVTGFPVEGDTFIWPDSYMIIRHPAPVTSDTTLKISGEVETGNLAIPISRSTSEAQDNYVAIPRPIEVTLDELGLVTDSLDSAFTPSASTHPLQRKDLLFVYASTPALRNRTPSAIYFYTGTPGVDGKWVKNVTGFPDAGSDPIEAGSGMVIRKAISVDDYTLFWNNAPTY